MDPVFRPDAAPPSIGSPSSEAGAAAPAPAPAGAVDAVVIGGSAGSIDALGRLFAGLPRRYRLPIAVVVHLPPRRASALAGVLASSAPLPVREAQDKEPFKPGAIYVAPPGYHLLLDAGPRLALDLDAPVHFSMPAIDVLFESAAAVLAPRLAGVVLTGANEDGAEGLAAIVAAGGLGIVQDPADAVAPAMPSAALRRCPGVPAASIAGIQRFLIQLDSPAND